MKPVINIAGHTFHRFTAISFVEKKRGNAFWLCKCVCGQSRVVAYHKLVTGHSKSCGCLKVEQFRARFRKHGQRWSVEWSTWRNIKTRCTNPKTWNWKNYGGRGITICDRWKNSFADFLADMGPRPSGEYSIDRIDNSRGYEPGNCRWADSKTQRANRRDSKQQAQLV